MPSVPLEPDAVRTAIAIVQDAIDAFPVSRATLESNVISPHMTNGVVQIQFERGEQAVAQAHRMRDHARRAFLREGFSIHRSDIDHASHELRDRSPDGVESAAARVKAAFDPHGIISPGRYLPDVLSGGRQPPDRGTPAISNVGTGS